MDPAAKGDSNPFSFKSFLKRGDGPPPPSAAAAVSQKPPTKKGSTSRKKGVRKGGLGLNDAPPTQEDSDLEGSKKQHSENPFSFVKFVEKSSTKKPASSAQRSIFTSSSGDEGEDSSLPMVNQVPLPPPSTRSVQKSSPTSTSAAGTKTARSAKTALSSPQRAKKTDWTNTRISIFDDGENVGGNSDSSPLTAARTARNGVVMGGASVVGVVRRHTSSSSSSSSSGNSPSSRRRSLVGGMSGLVLDDFAETAELKKLRGENERLQKELAHSQEEVKKQTEKNASLKNKIKVLKKKETEDTKALEDMVQKVETNIATTTKRAASAEATIARLKQEVASLQAQVVKNTPQAVHQHYEEVLRGVREKSSYASQQLATASAIADHNIRELLSGAEMLKNVAEVLQFVDKISEVRTSTDTSNSTT